MKKEEQMDARLLSVKLNGSVEVVRDSFERFNLQVINYGFCGINNNGWMEFLVELALLRGAVLPANVNVKVNIYDKNNSILYSEDMEIDSDDFSGYDTIHFYLNENNLAHYAESARLFATKA